MLASPSPEALIGPIAALTSRIRVGSGGVMLPHYSPLKVAETFSMLSGLFPGRIDLGIGRAAGTDPLATFALQRDRRESAPDDFPQQLLEKVEALIEFAESRGHTLLELAFSWLLAHRIVASVIAGATSAQQVQDNAAAATWKLTAADLEEIDSLLRAGV